MPDTRQRQDHIVTALGRFLVLFLLWWVISEGDESGLWFGAMAAALVAWFSVRFFPGDDYRIRWRALPGFVVFFLAESVAAGVDVALRLLRPALPIQPGEVTLTTRLPGGAPRGLLANTLSLLPGTLTVSLRGDTLVLHGLDLRTDPEASVRKVEARIASLFGCRLEPGS
jgi:multicomponent Na+:H+ antiporter subunit E